MQSGRKKSYNTIYIIKIIRMCGETLDDNFSACKKCHFKKISSASGYGMRRTSFSPGFICAVGVGGINTSSYPFKCFLTVPWGRANAREFASPDPIKSSNAVCFSLASSKEEKLASDISLSKPNSAFRLFFFSSLRRSFSICFADSV